MKKFTLLTALLMSGLMVHAQRSATLVTPPANARVETWHVDGAASSFFLYDSAAEDWYDNTGFMSTLGVAVSGNDVYVRGLAYWFSDAWIKGTLNDAGVVTFPATTLVGEDEYGKEYIAGSADGLTTCTFTCTFDAAAKKLTLSEGVNILEIGESIANGYYSFWNRLSLAYTEIVTPPADLPTDEYIFAAQTLNIDEDGETYYTPTTFAVHIGFDGSDAYIKGLACEYYLADAWVKGTVADGTITLPTGQYLGAAFDYYDLYFMGYDGTDVADVRLTIDDEGRTLTTDDWLLVSANRTLIYPYVTYTDAQFEKMEVVATTPAMPKVYTFTDSDFGYYTQARVSAEDVDGNPLVRSHLSLRLLTDTEGDIQTYTLRADDYAYIDDDLTEIAYGFAEDWDIYYDENYDDYMIYLNSGDAASWSRFGMQSIYEVDGKTYESAICWYDISAISTVAGAQLNGMKLATYYNSREDATLPAGTTICTATLTADSRALQLHAVEGNVIPADNAVVLLTTANVIYGVTTAEASATTQLSADNALMGTDLAWSSFYDVIRMLADEDGVTGFCKRDYPYIGAHSAYVSAYGTGSSSVLPLQLDESTTGIARLTATGQSAPAYNLSGQRVTPQFRGLTIQNGKKVYLF